MNGHRPVAGSPSAIREKRTVGTVTKTRGRQFCERCEQPVWTPNGHVWRHGIEPGFTNVVEA